MAILDSLLKRLNPATKAPTFNTTEFSRNNIFEELTRDFNYLDQYVNYTYKSIDYIAKAVADKDPELREKISEDDYRNLYNSDLMEDLKNFNPWLNLYDARILKEMHLRLTGVAFWFIAREELSDGFQKAEFYPIADPTRVKIDTDDYGLPKVFRLYDGDGVEQVILPENMIYFRNPSHKNWIEGYSQVEALRTINNAFNLGSEHNMNLLANNGRPDFLLKMPNITDEQRRAVEKSLKARYSGIKTAGRAGVINHDADILSFSTNNKELEFVESMKMLRQDILAMFGIPEALVFPSATNSNTKESTKIFQRDTVKPALKQEASVFTEQLIPKYYLGQRADQLKKYYFTYENIIDVDKKELSEVIEIQLRSGAITRNEARKQLGLGQDPEGDVYLSPIVNEQVIEQDNSDLEKQIQDLQMHVKGLQENLNTKLESKNDVMRKAFEESKQGEKKLRPYIDTWFTAQAERMIKYYQDRKPTLKGYFDIEEENKLSNNHFELAFDELASETAQAVNTEVRSKLFKANNPKFISYKDKGLDISTVNEISRRLSIFSNEINSTTKDQLQQAIKKAIEKDLSNRQLQESIANIFNGYLEGQGNVDTLTKYGVYIEKIGITQEGGVVIGSNNRYNAMLERITNTLTGEQQKAALQALYGVLDPDDQVAQTIKGLLTSIYKINPVETITEFRAAKIARTESTAIRNLTFRNQYESNEFVTKLEWISALQPGVTRDAHLSAYGQTVDKGKPFIVDGEKLKYPGDSNGSPSNIINCRCRIAAVVE